MPGKCPIKAAERSRRYRLLKKIEKYGPESATVNMSGRHGNHPKGEKNARWNPLERRKTSHGYIAVRVAPDHPHAWGPNRLKRFKYAYEHVVVMMSHIGRSLLPNEIVHHRNGDRSDNRLDNLELMTKEDHQRYHANETRGRDSLGRFTT